MALFSLVIGSWQKNVDYSMSYLKEEKTKISNWPQHLSHTALRNSACHYIGIYISLSCLEIWKNTSYAIAMACKVGLLANKRKEGECRLQITHNAG